MSLTAAINLTVKKPSFGSMKAEIKSLTVAAQQAVMEFGEFSVEARKAEQALAEAKDRMDDFNDRVSAVNPDKFEKVNTVVQGVARGFQAAQGAMALFGSDSEDLQKQMVKLQGAMALSEGLAGLGKTQQQFKAIFASIATGAKQAFLAIRAGIGSTGIGLLVIALGAIVAYWDDIKGAISGASVEQKKLLADAQKNQKVEEDKLEALNASDNILKLQGKTEKEILQLKINQTQAVITQLEAQLTTQESIKKSQVEAAQRNRDILQGVIRFLTLPLSTLLLTIDMIGNTLGQDFGLEKQFSEGLANLVFDPKDVEKKGNETIKETKKQLNGLKDTVAGYELGLKEIDKQGKEEAKKKGKEAQDEQQKQLGELYKKKATLIAEDYANGLISKKQQDDQLFALEGERLIAELKLAKQQKLSTTELESQIANHKIAENERVTKSYVMSDEELAKFKDDSNTNELAALDKFYKEKALRVNQDFDNGIITKEQADAKLLQLETDRLNNALQIAKDNGQSTVDIEAEIAAKKIELNAATAQSAIDAEAAKEQAQDEFIKASRDAINALGGLFKQGSDAAKAAALADIAIGTGIGFINALDIAQKGAKATGPAAPFAFPIFYASQLAAVLGAASRARAILKSGGSGPSKPTIGSPGTMPQVSAPVVGSSLPQTNGFESRVYVTEGDISRTQNRVANTKKVSVVK